MAPASRADHPRSRGVYPGSSTSMVRSRWIIPARAGFTPGRVEDGAADGDHPRSRGVYHLVIDAGRVFWGSSPLARGLRLALSSMGRKDRIIPARAGFTRSSRASSARSTDHPRSRGVYHRIIWRPGASRRIIPARAGFTVRPREAPAQGPDHPRSRGVYMSRRRKSTPVIGSSPLARGLLAEPLTAAQAAGIIPARAGFTATRPARSG